MASFRVRSAKHLSQPGLDIGKAHSAAATWFDYDMCGFVNFRSAEGKNESPPMRRGKILVTYELPQGSLNLRVRAAWHPWE